MGFTVVESVESRNGSTVEGSRKYVVRHDGSGGDGEYDARLAVIAEAPDSIGTAPYLQYMRDVTVDELVSSVPTTYMASAQYVSIVTTVTGSKTEPPPPVQTDQVAFNFNAQAQGGHIDTSLETILMKTASGGMEADPNLPYNNHINVAPNFEVRGLDLQPPEPNLELIWTPANSKVSVGFRKSIVEVVGHTNSSSFNLMGETFAEGELFLCYLRGGKRTDEDHEIAVGFAYAANLASTSLGGISVPKKGHEYIWADIWKEHKVGEGLVISIDRVVVERVWPKLDFNATPLSNLSGLVPT